MQTFTKLHDKRIFTMYPNDRIRIPKSNIPLEKHLLTGLLVYLLTTV